MGKGWKNPKKIAAAQKKGAVFTKLAREISVAARMGGGDPSANARLSLAIQVARSASCPKDTIERAINKGSGVAGEGTSFEECTYEGFGPHQVGVIVECQTDNRNRTISSIRSIFKKKGAGLGESGSVGWMFDRVSLIEGKKAELEDAEEEAIESGANEVEAGDEADIYSFYGAPEDLGSIQKALKARGWEISAAELSYKAKNQTELTEAQLSDVHHFLELLDEDEDSHRVYASL